MACYAKSRHVTEGLRYDHRGMVTATCDLHLPPVIFGISALGNLYKAIPEQTKQAIVKAGVGCFGDRTVFDGAGKYGAGLALECLGRSLRAVGRPADGVLISNKLGWRRTPLSGPEPTFEPGAWVGLTHDAVQDISHDGILRCWEEGDRLLGSPFTARLVSVHDPDEYLAAARSPAERERRFADILGAYHALAGLRRCGAVRAVGIGCKDWRVAREITKQVRLDWVMLACAPTVYSHPDELIDWIADLARQGIAVIDSALFHGGFLTGGDRFDYRLIEASSLDGRRLIAWRARFHELCATHGVTPAAACVRFAFRVPGVVSVALNTADPARVAVNAAMGTTEVPGQLWHDLADAGLIDRRFA